jgi:predicted transcriptional regulator
MSDFKALMEFVKERKVITTKALIEKFGYSELAAYRLMSLLMTRGLVAQEWDVYQGGFPVLTQKDVSHASAN